MSTPLIERQNTIRNRLKWAIRYDRAASEWLGFGALLALALIKQPAVEYVETVDSIFAIAHRLSDGPAKMQSPSTVDGNVTREKEIDRWLNTAFAYWIPDKLET